MDDLTQALCGVAAQFQLRGPLVAAQPWGSGHINDTYRLTVEQGGCPIHYILQRVNQRVFPKVDQLMSNIQRVTAHLGAKLAAKPDADPGRGTLTLIPANDGKAYWQNPENGDCWRVYVFIEKAQTYDAVTNPSQAYEAARTFALFQCELADLPAPQLYETIVGFHDTPKRFERFKEVLKADALGRAAQCRKEIDFVLAHEHLCHLAVDRLADGSLPCRVTHNDTKINNVMLDDATGKGICVIDLDTVMPGTVLYDFGDEIRTTTATAAEDEQDLSKVNFDLSLYKALEEGYLSGAAGFLTAEEKRLLPYSGQLLTFETGMRFLTDLLEGDVYFKVHRPGHNLDRCRTQFELVAQMEKAFGTV